MAVPDHIDAVAVEEFRQRADPHVTPGALALPEVPVVVLVGGVRRVVVGDELPDHVRSAVLLRALERRKLSLEPLVLLAVRANVLVGIDREEDRVAVPERIVVFGGGHVHVAIVVVGVLLVVADHRIHAHAREERAHAREELVHPLPLDWPLIDEIAGNEQEVGPQPPDLLGQTAIDRRVALGVAHHGEGEGGLRPRCGLKRANITLEPRLATFLLDEHLIVVPGLGGEPVERGGMQEAIVARGIDVAVESGRLAESNPHLRGPAHLAHHADARAGGVLQVGLHEK